MSRIVRVNADAKPRCIEIGREALSEINPGALLADGLEDAFVGYTLNTHHAHVAEIGRAHV